MGFRNTIKDKVELLSVIEFWFNNLTGSYLMRVLKKCVHFNKSDEFSEFQKNDFLGQNSYSVTVGDGSVRTNHRVLVAR